MASKVAGLGLFLRLNRQNRKMKALKPSATRSPQLTLVLKIAIQQPQVRCEATSENGEELRGVFSVMSIVGELSHRISYPSTVS